MTEVTHVTHVPWKTRLWQSAALVGLLAGIAILARAPGWEGQGDAPVKWHPPHIEVLNEARELTLDVTLVPAHPDPALRTTPGPDLMLTQGDGIDLAMRNRSEQEVFVAVFTINSDNAVTWLVPQTHTPRQATATRTPADSRPQPLARVTVEQDTPLGRLDIVGMFFTEPVPLNEIGAALHDGGMTALRNMQHVMAMDTVPTTVVPVAPEAAPQVQ